MSSSSHSNNFSTHAVAAAYALNYVPQAYYQVKMTSASSGAFTNITPRTNLDTLKSRLDSVTWNKLARAHGAHFNALEGFPLFAAAMIAGNMAQMPTKELNMLAAEYLGVRMLYNVLYLTVRTEAASYLRSGAYFWSVGIPFYGLWRAANMMM